MDFSGLELYRSFMVEGYSLNGLAATSVTTSRGKKHRSHKLGSGRKVFLHVSFRAINVPHLARLTKYMALFRREGRVAERRLRLGPIIPFIIQHTLTVALEIVILIMTEGPTEHA